VRLTWGEIEAALPRELYDRVYAVLMERYNAGSNFGSDLSKALTEFADGCENRGN
jgi:hypothetical protein